LPQEGRNLPLASGRVSGVAEAGVRLGGGDEGIVGVEASGWAGCVVAMFEHLFEGGLGNEGAKISRRTRRSRGRRRRTRGRSRRRRRRSRRLSPALALATRAAVVDGGAAPPPLAATETPWAQCTSCFRSTLHSVASSN